MKSTITLKRPENTILRDLTLNVAGWYIGKSMARIDIQLFGVDLLNWVETMQKRSPGFSPEINSNQVTIASDSDKRFPQNISSSDRVVLLCMGGSTLGQLGAQLEDYERLVVEPLHCILSLLWVSSGSTYLLRKNKNMK